MSAMQEPAWLVAWREGKRAAPQPAPAPRPRPAPKVKAKPVKTGNPYGFVEPERWPYDGGVRREPVLDMVDTPPRLVRRVGWLNCIRCGKPFFSEDVAGVRMCGSACREDNGLEV